MWELYALWAWLPLYLAASWASWRGSTAPHTATEIVSFAAIGVAGAVGAVGGGLIADRIGRAQLIIAALAVSGTCCILSVLAFGLNPAVVACLALVWGVAVIADSAQFSAALTELTDVRYTGTALTAQTAMGFLLTVASIRFVPWFAGEVGWRWALVPLWRSGPRSGSWRSRGSCAPRCRPQRSLAAPRRVGRAANGFGRLRSG